MVRRVGRPEGPHYTGRVQRDPDDLSYIGRLPLSTESDL